MNEPRLIVNARDLGVEKLADVYKQLKDPNRNIVAMGANLLLASQIANATHDKEVTHNEGGT